MMIGNVRVRHRGTIGGSLAHAEATAELPCVTVALGGTVYTLGPGGERSIAAGDLFVTHFTTTLEPDEVITRIEIPVLAPRQGSAFVEMVRRPGDLATAEVAALITLAEDGMCRDARLVVSATGDRPIDVSSTAVDALRGELPDERLFTALGTGIAAELEIGPSTHGGADYRREMVKVLVKRALLLAENRARSRAGDSQ
jgi:CO/xanthine dehydrogenase FAD-binding subunit